MKIHSSYLTVKKHLNSVSFRKTGVSFPHMFTVEILRNRCAKVRPNHNLASSSNDITGCHVRVDGAPWRRQSLASCSAKHTDVGAMLISQTKITCAAAYHAPLNLHVHRVTHRNCLCTFGSKKFTNSWKKDDTLVSIIIELETRWGLMKLNSVSANFRLVYLPVITPRETRKENKTRNC